MQLTAISSIFINLVPAGFVRGPSSFIDSVLLELISPIFIKRFPNVALPAKGISGPGDLQETCPRPLAMPRVPEEAATSTLFG
jgi:hypothetical protein